MQAPTRASGFLNNVNGNVAMIFAVSVPMLFAACWIAVNYFLMLTEWTEAQAAADAGAIAGARQFALSQQTVASIQNVAVNMARGSFPSTDLTASPDLVSADVNLAQSTVTVTVTRTLKPLFGENLGVSNNVVSANATASTHASPICVLILDPSSPSAFNAFGSSNMSAPGCTIISDSRSSTGLSGTTGGVIASAKACSAGGFAGGAFAPQPITDCPVVLDPLAIRKPPPNVNAACDYTGFTYTSTIVPLNPGVYCGGINIKHGTAIFNPGDYIIRGGSLTISAGGAVEGSGVGIYLTGGAVLDGQPNSGISLSAPANTSDPMVGLVFWEDPNNLPSGSHAIHKIWSDNAQNLHGTVYFPQGTLNLGGHANVGSTSAYTIIVAYDLIEFQSANVVLNTNYAGSAIPAPPGVGNTKTGVVLIK